MSFDKFVLAVESRDLSQADKYYKSVFFSNSQSCFWMIKFTVIPKTTIWHLYGMFWSILSFKNLQDGKVKIFLSFSGER